MDVLADGCTKKYAGVYSQENGKMTIFFIFTQNCCSMPIHGKSWVRIFFFDLLSTQHRPRIDLECCTEIPTSLFVNPEGRHPCKKNPKPQKTLMETLQLCSFCNFGATLLEFGTVFTNIILLWIRNFEKNWTTPTPQKMPKMPLNMNLTIIFSFFPLGLDLPNHFRWRAPIKTRRKNEFGKRWFEYAHTHTHTCMHACTHACMHTHTLE